MPVLSAEREREAAARGRERLEPERCEHLRRPCVPGVRDDERIALVERAEPLAPLLLGDHLDRVARTRPVIVSVHISEGGVRRSLALLRRGRRPLTASGLRYSEAAGLVPLAGKAPPLPPRGTILISSWDDDDALDRFLAENPIDGYHVRMRPTRIVGAWPEMPGLPAEEVPMDDDEPATVLTLGRPRLRTLLRFARTSGPAERLAVEHAGMAAGTAAARLPRFVATFSIWRTVRQMRDYALGRPDGRHLDAIKANRSTPFHHQDAFVRFRPYASSGTWGGSDPLAATSGATR